ncbi:hypothetical protein L3Y34_015708 [Caenorhabditis briggsae]|uniref:Uncharacterized protein n=1 Tax=Caenorhabditis briggsae TaxID=6238 RepID=A0AAE9DXE2_CAEBR|nr:hypothetical protein L3Y34_015708 [Caenorhabditis briggsae]
MKLRLHVVLVLLIHGYWYELSYKENRKRLEECGKNFLPKPDKKEAEISHSLNDWIVKVRTKKQKTKIPPTTGSFISSRHIITSAQSILTSGKKWRYNGEDASGNCSHPELDLEVPKEIVNHIEIFRGDCENGWQCEPPLRAQKAVILNFCDQDDQFDRMFRIMLIEVKEFETSSFACISNDTTKLQMKELVNTYGFDDERLVYRLLEVTNIGKGYILTSKYYVYGDRGGPMVVDRNERGTIVGIGASTGWSDNSGNTWFFELSHHFENICNVTGICEGNPVNTTMDPANIKTTEMESTVYFKRK